MALVRGALASQGPAALDAPMSRAAGAHYQDFGHSMIYTYKARQLVEALGEDMAEPIYLSLAHSLVYASRENLIPEFRAYGKTRAAWDGTGSGAVDGETFRKLGLNKALEAALAASRDLQGLFDALVGAAAWQMLHFDMGVMVQDHRQVPDNVNWLDFTHALTFANAGRFRRSVTRRSGPIYCCSLLVSLDGTRNTTMKLRTSRPGLSTIRWLSSTRPAARFFLSTASSNISFLPIW